MRLLTLIKKDFLIIKKYVLLMFVVTILIPPFMLWRIPDYAGATGFVFSALFAVFMLMQYNLQTEAKNHKAAALLCATPYPRSMMVASKYIFCMIIFIVVCCTFKIETMFLKGLGTLTYQMAAAMFFVIAVFYGIYVPLQYKMGHEKTKFAIAIVIMACPFLFPQLLKMSGGRSFLAFGGVEPMLIYGGIALTGAIVFAISALISVRIYSKADLR